MPLTREQEQQAAKERIQKDYQNRNSYGFAGKQVIDLEALGGYTKELFYKAKEGYNKIDILPYLVTTDKHPQKVEIGLPDYVLDLWVHRRVGPSKSNFICLKEMYGLPCHICEEREELEKDPKATKKEIGAMRAKHRCFYCVVDLDLPEAQQTIQLLEESHYLFGKHLLSASVTRSGEFVPFFEREIGQSIEFQAEKVTSTEGSYFNYKQFVFFEREPYTMEIYDDTFPLDKMLIIPSYEEVRNSHMGLGDDGEPTVEAQESPADKNPQESSSGGNQQAGGLRRGRGGPKPAEQVDEKADQRKKEGEALFEDKKEEPAQEAEAPKPRARGERKRGVREKPVKAAEPVNSCPFGHVFGKDNDSVVGDCKECEQSIWDLCSAEYDKLNQK